jgi:hypothetical protein
MGGRSRITTVLEGLLLFGGVFRRVQQVFLGKVEQLVFIGWLPGSPSRTVVSGDFFGDALLQQGRVEYQVIRWETSREPARFNSPFQWMISMHEVASAASRLWVNPLLKVKHVSILQAICTCLADR